MKKDQEKSKEGKFSLGKRLRSFPPAFRGLGILVRYEHNARIHLFIFCLVVLAGFIFRIRPSGWLAIIFVSALVLAGECFNSAIEYLADEITEKENRNIGKAKDVAAAGVLIAALAAIVTGVLVFVPAILRFFGHV